MCVCWGGVLARVGDDGWAGVGESTAAARVATMRGSGTRQRWLVGGAGEDGLGSGRVGGVVGCGCTTSFDAVFGCRTFGLWQRRNFKVLYGPESFYKGGGKRLP